MPENSWAIWLQRRWYSRRAPLLLRPLSGLFRVAIDLRSTAYRQGWLRSSHPGAPVVVVGNLTVGGTGKTPFTLWLADALRTRGVRAGIASRGYGGSARGPVFVDARSDAGVVGDEALLLAQRSGVPVCIARRRIEAARALVKQGCQIVLADDGLQHLALRRDLEIVVVDAARGFGNGALLPAGPLREPVRRLESVDLVVIQGEQRPAAVGLHRAIVHMTLQPQPLVSLLAGGTHSPPALAGEEVHAVAAIGNPGRFFEQLRAMGMRVIEHPFPDHHRFVARDLAFGDPLPVLMTEKDAVKCRAFADGRMWFLPVTAQLPPADAGKVLDAVLGLIAGGGRTGA